MNILFPIKEFYTTGQYIKVNSFKIKNNKILTDESIKINYIKDHFINNEHYEIKIIENEIDIIYDSYNSYNYALDTLKNLYKNNSLPVCKIIDEPSFKNRGLIEGYYGKPYSFKERKDYIKSCRAYRLNCYYYAPKDDKYHRELWNELYPSSILKEMKDLVKLANNNNVKFVYCLSPGLNIKYSSKDDLDLLFKKIDQLISIKVKDFCICLDDIDVNFKNNEDAKVFDSLAKAHSFLCNQVNLYLKTKLDHFTLSMCPTDYMQKVITPYRNDLANNLDHDISIMWTGYNTVAEVISSLDGLNATKIFKHDLILWDNYPVNDYAKAFLFLGPIVNRSCDLHLTHSTYMINPMEHYKMSKLAIISQALYSYNPYAYDSEKAYNIALKALKLTKYKDLIDFFKDSTIYIYQKDFSNIGLNSYINKCHKALKELTLLNDETINNYKIAFEKELELINLIKANLKNEAINLINDIEALDYKLFDSYAISLANIVFSLKDVRKRRMNYFNYLLYKGKD